MLEESCSRENNCVWVCKALIWRDRTTEAWVQESICWRVDAKCICSSLIFIFQPHMMVYRLTYVPPRPYVSLAPFVSNRSSCVPFASSFSFCLLCCINQADYTNKLYHQHKQRHNHHSPSSIQSHLYPASSSLQTLQISIEGLVYDQMTTANEGVIHRLCMTPPTLGLGSTDGRSILSL